MKIYTRTGDKGQTSIIGGRVDKDHIRVDAYGTIDEANGFVGQAVTQLQPDLFQDLLDDLEKIQHELFDCGGDLANVTKKHIPKLTEEAITYLEERIDAYTTEAPELEKFILPGGSPAAATLHIARTVTRRAERLVVTLMKEEAQLSALPLQYLNRLSDYFFAAARVVNFRQGVKDIEYIRSASVFRDRTRKDNKEDEHKENQSN
ncbi:cob(I)yrinic acid a,c-diamide adenosyltransferase [Niallia sp. XMNu-256]|uniref:cob(I)yrinic acid a,c-diamide adenosyltransferase n=1 Tax=Niallia sp. XMNu-256 TaxID=3082444 RepID=UPI0030D453C3